METGNQPAIPSAADNARQTAPSNSIPVAERFPRLTSSQYRFTTAAAIKHLDPEERNVYRVVLKLSARPNTTFTNNNTTGIPWTFAVKDFIRMLNAHDAKAMILPRRENAKINKIASHDDIPESTDDFERDYAWNARLQGSTVTFTIMLSTTHPFIRTFKRGKVFEKLQDNNWYINLDRLETQETTAKVGMLLFAHSRWANQEEILDEIKQIIAPTVCTDIDVRVDRPYKTYYDREVVIENGSQKKNSIRTRWPAIYAPIDIAAELKNTLVAKWPTLQTNSEYAEFNCKQYLFIPDTPLPRNSRNPNHGFTAAQKKSYSNFLHYMRKQNIFLNTYSQVVVLQNVGDIQANFTWTEELAAHIVGSSSSVGFTQTLRHFLTTITRAANPDERTIHSIHREVERGTWTLLVDKEDAPELRSTLNQLVPFLQTTPAFSGIRVGGTNGAFHSEKHDHSDIGYLSILGTSTNYECEPTVLDAGGDSTMTTAPVQQVNFNAPPTTYRRGKKSTPARFVRPSATSAVMNYSDVLSTGTLRNNPYLQATQSNTSTLATQESVSTTLTSPDPSINVETLFQNQQFKRMMADLIEPHIAPARQEVLQMKSAMANLQEKTARIEQNVSSIATLDSKFDHLMGMMATMSQQISNPKPPSVTQQAPPHKKHCSDHPQFHDGQSTPHETFFSGSLHHNNTDDEAEAGRTR